MINSNIAMGAQPVQIENPMNALAKMMQIKQSMQENQMGQMKMDEYNRGVAQSNSLRNLMANFGSDTTQNQLALLKNGNLKEANDYAKNVADVAKTNSESDKHKSELLDSRFKQSRELLNGVTTPEQYLAWHEGNHSDPVLGGFLASRGITADQSRAKIMEALQQPNGLQTLIAQSSMGMDKFTERNTQSADNRATNNQSNTNSLRTAKTAANGQAITLRGQDVGESRAEAKRIADESKPLPSQALKMQQTALDAIGVASNTQSDIDAVLKQIDSKKLKFGLVSNALNKARDNTIGSSEESRNLSSFKSSIEKMRNDSLRLNAGVQTDGDAQRAWNELFENINDTELVKQRLGEIKKINARAVGLHKLNVENVRANYGKPELDTSRYENQGAAIGAAYSDAEKERRYQEFKAKAGQK